MHNPVLIASCPEAKQKGSSRMNQCLKITFIIKIPKNFLHAIQERAKDLGLEGTIQMPEDRLVLIKVCGGKEAVDSFVDILHKEFITKEAENIEIEPFLRERDYRGVFRVIE